MLSPLLGTTCPRIWVAQMTDPNMESKICSCIFAKFDIEVAEIQPDTKVRRVGGRYCLPILKRIITNSLAGQQQPECLNVARHHDVLSELITLLKLASRPAGLQKYIHILKTCIGYNQSCNPTSPPSTTWGRHTFSKA